MSIVQRSVCSLSFAYDINSVALPDAELEDTTTRLETCFDSNQYRVVIEQRKISLNSLTECGPNDLKINGQTVEEVNNFK